MVSIHKGLFLTLSSFCDNDKGSSSHLRNSARLVQEQRVEGGRGSEEGLRVCGAGSERLHGVEHFHA